MTQTLEERLEENQARVGDLEIEAERAMRGLKIEAANLLAQIEAKQAAERPAAVAEVLHLIRLHRIVAKELVHALRQREFKPRPRKVNTRNLE